MHFDMRCVSYDSRNTRVIDPPQYSRTGVHNEHGLCSLCGTNWAFKYNSDERGRELHARKMDSKNEGNENTAPLTELITFW